MVSPVSFSPREIGQLIDEGPRYFGSSDGWYWIVPCFGILTNSCGANCSTNAMMPMSAPAAFMRLDGLRRLQRLELVHLQALLLRRDPQRIGPGALLLRGAEHRGNLIAAGEEPLEHRFTEILLADNRDFHVRPPSSAEG